MFTCQSSTLAVFVDTDLFHGLLRTVFWGPKAISMVVEFQGALTYRSSTITVWADSGPFLGLLLYFGVSESFPRLTNPGVRLRVGHQHSLFWGPGVISTIKEPRGAFTCRSSTLIVLADSGPFHGLLLIVLGSWSGFHG